MRIAIASYGQETSSFSPVVTTLDTFRLYGLFEGEDILDTCRGVGSVGGFLEAMDEAGDWTPVPIVHGWAGASGPLTADTLDWFVDKVTAGLRAAGDLDAWAERVERLSAALKRHKTIADSHVEFEANHSVMIFASSEGCRSKLISGSWIQRRALLRSSPISGTSISSTSASR